MNLCGLRMIERLRVLQGHFKSAIDVRITATGQRVPRPFPGITSLRCAQHSQLSNSDSHNRTIPVSAHDLARSADISEVDVPYPLTKSEAIHFLEKVLKVPNPVKLCQENKISFLKKVTEGMNRALPFSNVVLLGRDRDLRVAPSLEECKQEVKALRGGSCFIVNTFNKALLELMGFRCHHVPGNDSDSIYNGTHVGLIVVDLRYPGSRDIVEAGTTKPLFDAIPLDFKDESPEYQFGHVRSKFFREEQRVGWYKEIEKDSQKTRNVMIKGGKKWEKLMEYEVDVLVPFPMMVKMHSVVWPSAKIIPEIHGDVMVVGYSGSDFVKIRGKYVSIIDKHLRECSKVAKTKEELIGVFQEYFPQFTKEMVVSAIDNNIQSW
ncbi:uncharacterized protein [Apostichopus japonicus]|uniref:uncharacterized protein n=1 Tax=Stichopus japonicus TaxID=307972 RepID=UPI003AB76FB8